MFRRLKKYEKFYHFLIKGFLMKNRLCAVVIVVFLNSYSFQASTRADMSSGDQNPLVQMRAIPIPTECASEKSQKQSSLKANNISIEALNEHVKIEREKQEAVKQKKIAAEKHRQYHRMLTLWNCHRLLSNPFEEKTYDAKLKNIETLQGVHREMKKIIQDCDFFLLQKLDEIDSMVNPKCERDYCCCPSIPGREAVLKQMAQLKQKIKNILTEEDNLKIKEFKKDLKIADFLITRSTNPPVQQSMNRDTFSVTPEELK
jgi:hypothetical protein